MSRELSSFVGNEKSLESYICPASEGAEASISALISWREECVDSAAYATQIEGVRCLLMCPDDRECMTNDSSLGDPLTHAFLLRASLSDLWCVVD